MSADWEWVPRDAVEIYHEEGLDEYGGLEGIRDAGALESALARPQNLAAYGEPDAADLAAAYAYGLARNHSFTDGNKRTAWTTANAFLEVNGYELVFDEDEAVAVMLEVAAGNMDEGELAAWFRERL